MATFKRPPNFLPPMDALNVKLHVEQFPFSDTETSRVTLVYQVTEEIATSNHVGKAETHGNLYPNQESAILLGGELPTSL